jgi:hypothetical protein
MAASSATITSAMPTSSGKIAPSNTGNGNADMPAMPSVSIVRNGPLSRHITEYAAASRGRPYCVMSAM